MKMLQRSDWNVTYVAERTCGWAMTKGASRGQAKILFNMPDSDQATYRLGVRLYGCLLRILIRRMAPTGSRRRAKPLNSPDPTREVLP